VSSPLVTLARKCKGCSRELPAEILACEQCHTLVHAEELERLSAAAKALEKQQDWQQARENWRKALPLLPRESTQSVWIQDHIHKLQAAADQADAQHTRSKWASKLGPLAPLALVLVKAKTFFLTIFKLKFLLSLGAFMALYWKIYGAWFGIGFALMILIHEMGHYIDIKRRGLPAEMPVFLPGLGAYVSWKALGVSGETRAAVSLAGPFAGWLASVACALLWWKTGNGIWAALARSGAWLNVMNLIPIWILDGGQAVLVLNKAERIVILSVCVLLALSLGEGVFFLVAAGAAWRLFTKDIPEQPSRVTTAYFVGVLACFALILWLMPGQGFGNR